MKINYPVIVLLLFLAGCVQYAQVIYVAPKSNAVKQTKFTNENYYFTDENDTISVVYYFWEEYGVMSFKITNKLDVPLYIDWKKSSFISKDMKYDYYFDKELKASASVSASYIYKPTPNWFNVYGPTIISGSIGSETTLKEERITFIPPKSYILRAPIKLYTKGMYFNLKGAVEKEIHYAGNDSAKTFSAYISEVGPVESQLFFRNFLTYSTKESFDKEYYINDEFYIRKIVTFNQDVFNAIEKPYPELYRNLKEELGDPRGFYITGIYKTLLF